MQENGNLKNAGTLPVDLLVVPQLSFVAGKETWVVDAKELYSFLKPAKPFLEWLEELINFYGYVEGRDFIGSLELGDVFLTLPMAREISMTMPTQAGRQARFYFVAFGNKHPQESIEDEDTEETSSNVPDQEATSASDTSPDEECSSVEVSQESSEEPDDQAGQLEELLDIGEASKELGVGSQFLYQYMVDIGWLFPGVGEPRIWTVRKGYMVYDFEQTDEDGTPGLLTEDGLELLQEKLIRLGIITVVSD